MCEEGLHDPFQDQVDCARFRAERDMLAQAMERVADDIEHTFLGFEGAEDAPAMRWAREFRAALGSLHAPVRDTTMSARDLLPEEEREAIAWVREHGGLEAVRGRLGERKRLIDLCRAYENALDMMADSMDVEKSSDKVVQARRTRKAIKKLERRLMPEGMEWPTVDGKPVDFVTGYEPSLGVLEAVSIYSNGACEVMGHDGIIKDVKEVHVATPKVLDADGVEIEVGDRVWSTKLDEPHEWIVIDPHEDRDDSQTVLVSIGDRTGRAKPENLTHQRHVLDADGRPLREGETVYEVDTGDEFLVQQIYGGTTEPDFPDHTVRCSKSSDFTSHMFRPEQLTHERPDSWERLEEDAGKEACEYFAHMPCGCETSEMLDETVEKCNAAKARDLVRRAKALAGDA